METIRNNAFETNSSSSHSIIIMHTNALRETILPVDGVVTIPSMGFGRYWARYHDALTKASCAFAYASNNRRSDNPPDVAKRIEDRIQYVVDIIKEHTGAKEVKMVCDESDSDWMKSSYPFGYIDHESTGVLNEVFDDKEELINWIFNPDCALITGSDEITPPPNILDEPGTVYKYELVLEGFPLTYRFEEYPTVRIDPETEREDNEIQEAIESIVEHKGVPYYTMFDHIEIPDEPDFNDETDEELEKSGKAYREYRDFIANLEEGGKWDLTTYDKYIVDGNMDWVNPWSEDEGGAPQSDGITDGVFSSFIKLNEGIVIFLKTKSDYDAKNRHYDKVIDRQEVKFQIKEIV